MASSCSQRAAAATSTCTAVESEIAGPAESEEELRALMVGQWLTCSVPAFFGTSDDVGLELTEDGQWFKLYPDGEGGVVRGHGSNLHGTFEVLDQGDSVQLDFQIGDGRAWHATPQFATMPHKVRLNNSGHVVDYIYNGPRGRCVDVPNHPPRGPYTPPVECENPSSRERRRRQGGTGGSVGPVRPGV